MNIYKIPLKQYKTSVIEVIFNRKINKDKVYLSLMLADMLNNSSMHYPSKRLLKIYEEDLYNVFYSASCQRNGEVIQNIFTFEFICPKYIKEKDYLDNIINFIKEVLYCPNQKDNSFNFEEFKITKSLFIKDVVRQKDEHGLVALRNALKHFDSSSISSINIVDYLSDIENVTPEELYQEYEDMIKTATVDIFMSGNFNMNYASKKMNTFIKGNNNNKLKYTIKSKERSKVLNVKEPSDNVQSNLICLYNINSLTQKESLAVFPVFNYIFGSGGLSSKLYKYVREEKGYCYQISSWRMKNDGILCINSSLSIKNVSKTIKLINKSLKEMSDGIFDEKDIADAKKNLILSLDIKKNNMFSLLNNKIGMVYFSSLSFDDIIKMINEVSKKDIIKLSKKIKENTYYTLEEANNEKN